MNELINTIISLLKIFYLIPFINYYIINKKENEELNNKKNDTIILGLTLIVINTLLTIISYFVKSMSGVKGIMNSFNLLIFQSLLNIILMIGYLILLINIYNKSNKKFSIIDLINLLIIILLITTLSPPNTLLIIISTTYTLAIYFLINAIIIMSESIKKLRLINYYLTIIGSIILILDPILLIKTYQIIINTNLNDGLTILFKNRLISYLIIITSMTLILIPNLQLLSKIRNRRIIKIYKKDSVELKQAKRLLNKLQEIYGDIVTSIYDKSLRKKLNDKLFLKDFIKELERTFPKKIINKALESEGIK